MTVYFWIALITELFCLEIWWGVESQSNSPRLHLLLSVWVQLAARSLLSTNITHFSGWFSFKCWKSRKKTELKHFYDIFITDLGAVTGPSPPIWTQHRQEDRVGSRANSMEMKLVGAPAEQRGGSRWHRPDMLPLAGWTADWELNAPAARSSSVQPCC